MTMCIVQCLCAMPMCNACVQCLCAMPMCNVYVQLARLILTLGARYKDALWLKKFLFIYKNDLPKKKFFFFATTG